MRWQPREPSLLRSLAKMTRLKSRIIMMMITTEKKESMISTGKKNTVRRKRLKMRIWLMRMNHQ